MIIFTYKTTIQIMKKLLSKNLILILILTAVNSFGQQNFDNFLKNYQKSTEKRINTNEFLEKMKLKIDINEVAFYIKANENIEKYLLVNNKVFLNKNNFIQICLGCNVMPLSYYKNKNSYFLLNYTIEKIENDRLAYSFFIKNFSLEGKSKDSLVVGKYLPGEDLDIQSSSIISFNYDSIETNYYSKVYYEKIEKPVIKNLKIKYIFNSNTDKYMVLNQKLHTDNQNSIYDIQDINFNFFNGDATNILQYDFNKEKLKIDIGISKNKKTLYLIYSQIEAHGFLEHLSHNFLHFNNTILKSTLSGDNLIIDFADKKRVKVTLNSYNRSKKYMMFNEYQLFDTNGNLIEKKSFQNLEYITNLPKLLKMDQ